MRVANAEPQKLVASKQSTAVVRLSLPRIAWLMATRQIPTVVNDCLLRNRPLVYSTDKDVRCAREEETPYCLSCFFYQTRLPRTKSSAEVASEDEAEDDVTATVLSETVTQVEVSQPKQVDGESFAPVKYETVFQELHPNRQWAPGSTPADLVRESWLKDHVGKRIKVTIEHA